MDSQSKLMRNKKESFSLIVPSPTLGKFKTGLIENCKDTSF